MTNRTALSFTTPGGFAVTLSPRVQAGDRSRLLLCVHGTATTIELFAPLLAELPHVPALSVTLPFHGASVDGRGSVIDAGVEAITEALDAVGACDVVGVGVSLGATMLVEAQRRRPGLCAGLVLCAPPGDFPAEARDQHRAFAAAFDAGLSDDLVALVSSVMYVDATAARPRVRAMLQRHRLPSIASYLRRVAEIEDLAPRWEGFETGVPTIALWGSADAACPRAWGEPLFSAVGARTVVVDGGGHLLVDERARDTARILQALLHDLG